MRMAFIITVRSKADPEELRDFWFIKKKEAHNFIHLAQEKGFEITAIDEMMILTHREALYDLDCYESLTVYHQKKLASRH